MQLDFSAISDDQLIDLIRAACAEAGQRSVECAAAARNAMLDEAERAKIAREAIERERLRSTREEAERIAREALAKEKAAKEAEEQKAKEKKIADTWAWKEEMGRRVSEILRPKNPQTLTVWNKGDKRIYLGKGYNGNMVVYYHTGSARNKPRSIAIVKRPGNFTEDEWKSGKEQEVEAALLPVFDGICQKWNTIEFEIPAYAPAGEEQKEVA